jgi:hypothetical protein
LLFAEFAGAEAVLHEPSSLTKLASHGKTCKCITTSIGAAAAAAAEAVEGRIWAIASYLPKLQ